jgi:predicted negative regulator of RcsB-dependent stress response
MVRPRTLLLIMVLGIVPAFAFVNAIVSAAHARRDAIARDWAQQAESDLARGRPERAAEGFRTANEYARERGAYRLQLAQALVAAGHRLEAAAQLHTLWNERPGDGVVNLQLARVAADDGRADEAVRYYHAAINGAWDTNAADARRAARLELARFLLARNQRVQAQAELTMLAGDLPTNPSDPAAARLAGEVAFDTGDYQSARRYLDRVGQPRLDSDGRRMLAVSTRVLQLDPDARGLRSRERLRRVVTAFDIGSAALDRCPADSLAALRDERDAMKHEVDDRALARDPDAADAALTFAGRAIATVRAACGEGSDDERALALVLQRRHQA